MTKIMVNIADDLCKFLMPYNPIFFKKKSYVTIVAV